MLIKKELAQIPLIKCPAPSKKAAEHYTFLGAAKAVKMPRSGRLLVIDVYDKKERILKLRFFFDGKNAILCTEWPTENWLTKRSELLLGYGAIWSSDDDVETTKKFISGYERSLGGLIDRAIRDISWEKSRKAYERKYAKQEEHFAMYPDYPADLAKYCDLHVFPHSYIFINKAVKGKRDGICGHCRKKFKVDKAVRAGSMGKCPKCGRSAKYRGAWLKSTVLDKANICIAAKVDGQLLLRWAYVYREYSAGDPKSKYDFVDCFYNLYLHTTKGPTIYSYALLSLMGCGWNWFRKKNETVNYEETHIYTANLAEVFGDSYYHVNLQEGLYGAGEISFPRLLDNLKNNPATEYLFKLGLTKLAASSDVLDIQGGNFCEVFGVNKQYMPLYRRHNVTRFEIKVVEASRTWVSDEMFIKFRALQLEWSLDIISDLLETMSFERFVNYFTKQFVLTRWKKADRLLTWYRDYISMSKSLGVDLTKKSVQFPKCIKTAHDLVTPRFNEITYAVEDANFAQATEKLYTGMKEYAKDGYCIVFPTKRTEFITEGQSLNHCVGSDTYYQNHLKGIRMVFFVRRAEAPDKPFYTLEIDMRALRIMQLYGFGDSSATAEVRKFANAFLHRLQPAESERVA